MQSARWRIWLRLCSQGRKLALRLRDMCNNSVPSAPPLPSLVVFFRYIPRLFISLGVSVCSRCCNPTFRLLILSFLFSRFVWRAEQVFIVETLRNVRQACSSVLRITQSSILFLSLSNARIETRSYLENIILHFRCLRFFFLFIVYLSFFDGMLFDFSFSSLRHLFLRQGRVRVFSLFFFWLDSSGTTGGDCRFGYPPLICGRVMQRSASVFRAITKLRFVR